MKKLYIIFNKCQIANAAYNFGRVNKIIICVENGSDYFRLFILNKTTAQKQPS
jgi:hypothetical protein